MDDTPTAPERTSLRELGLLFLRLGATAFGGPAAHIAMMHDEVVHRRKWLSEERFLDLLGATQLIPGPNSTELAIHIGWQRRRFAGLLVAGLAFIVPAMLITGALGWNYVRAGALPEAQWLLYGVKPVVVAIVAQAIVGLLPGAAPSLRLRVMTAVALGLALVGVNELVVLLGAGAIAVATARVRVRALHAVLPIWPVFAAAVSQAPTLAGLFGVFVKIGSLIFGSGYVLLAFLRADLVMRLGWLTESQLVDAVAVGQALTPGPVFTTATFIGFLLAGARGALVATAGIFLPAFVFVAASGPLVPRLRESKAAGAFLDGVNVASLALMAAAAIRIAHVAFVDAQSLVIGALATLLLLRYKVNASWLVLGGAAVGWLVSLTRSGVNGAAG